MYWAPTKHSWSNTVVDANGQLDPYIALASLRFDVRSARHSDSGAVAARISDHARCYRDTVDLFNHQTRAFSSPTAANS